MLTRTAENVANVDTNGIEHTKVTENVQENGENVENVDTNGHENTKAHVNGEETVHSVNEL